MMWIKVMKGIEDNYQRVLEKIENSTRSVGRDPDDVRLVVVTKGHTIELARAAVIAGAKYLGENYVEEAIPKIRAISGEFKVEWHMIGHVQSRKARRVCEYFSWVHSLDSIKLAKRLNRFAEEMGRTLPVLIECNVSGEKSKFGWIAWEEHKWSELEIELAQILELPKLEVRGLMTMAPLFPDPEQARPYYQRLRRLRDYLAQQYPTVDWSELSMGMSADYEVAIQEGATIVRVGTAILGERHN